MTTQKVAFQHGKVFLKIGEEGEIGLDGAESGGEPLVENNPNLTDCSTSQKNSNVVQKERAKDTSVGQVFPLTNQNGDGEEKACTVSIGNELLESEGEKWESLKPVRRSPSLATQPKPDSLSITASEENFKKEVPATRLVSPEQGTSQLQENVDSGYETSAPFEDKRSNLEDGTKEASEGILGLKTDLEIFPEDDPGEIGSQSDAGNKVAIEEAYEENYDADEFEPDDEE